MISTVAGEGPFDRRMFDAIGREYRYSVDYIYYYNLLYQMGISAGVSFINMEYDKKFGSPEDAFESVTWMFQEMTPDEEMKLRKFLDKHLVEKNGFLSLDYSRMTNWAVFWWDR